MLHPISAGERQISAARSQEAAHHFCWEPAQRLLKHHAGWTASEHAYFPSPACTTGTAPEKTGCIFPLSTRASPPSRCLPGQVGARQVKLGEGGQCRERAQGELNAPLSIQMGRGQLRPLNLIGQRRSAAASDLRCSALATVGGEPRPATQFAPRLLRLFPDLPPARPLVLFIESAALETRVSWGCGGGGVAGTAAATASALMYCLETDLPWRVSCCLVSRARRLAGTREEPDELPGVGCAALSPHSLHHQDYTGVSSSTCTRWQDRAWRRRSERVPLPQIAAEPVPACGALRKSSMRRSLLIAAGSWTRVLHTRAQPPCQPGCVLLGTPALPSLPAPGEAERRSSRVWTSPATDPAATEALFARRGLFLARREGFAFAPPDRQLSLQQHPGQLPRPFGYERALLLRELSKVPQEPAPGARVPVPLASLRSLGLRLFPPPSRLPGSSGEGRAALSSALLGASVPPPLSFPFPRQVRLCQSPAHSKLAANQPTWPGTQRAREAPAATSRSQLRSTDHPTPRFPFSWRGGWEEGFAWSEVWPGTGRAQAAAVGPAEGKFGFSGWAGTDVSDGTGRNRGWGPRAASLPRRRSRQPCSPPSSSAGAGSGRSASCP